MYFAQSHHRLQGLLTADSMRRNRSEVFLDGTPLVSSHLRVESESMDLPDDAARRSTSQF